MQSCETIHLNHPGSAVSDTELRVGTIVMDMQWSGARHNSRRHEPRLCNILAESGAILAVYCCITQAWLSNGQVKIVSLVTWASCLTDCRLLSSPLGLTAQSLPEAELAASHCSTLGTAATPAALALALQRTMREPFQHPLYLIYNCMYCIERKSNKLCSLAHDL